MKTNRLIQKATEQSLTSWILFILACLLPICIFRDYTPANELRYISIADEAIRNNNWFSLTNHGVPYSDKPPFYFWLIMVSKLLTGEYHMGILILYSLLPALGICYTLQKWTSGLISKKYQNALPLLLITTGYYAGTAMVLRMDMLMVWFIVLALYEFYQMYRGLGSFRKHQILFAIYIVLGVYSKAFMGVLIPLVTSLCFLIYKKEGKTFGKYWNWKVWAIILGGMAFWFGMVILEAGTQYLYDLTVGQTVSRSVQVSVHKRPFYYYFIFLSYSIAPWTLMYLATIISGIRRKIFRSDIEILFLIEIVTTFVMLSCFGSKLAIYLVPIFPFITCLSLIGLEHNSWNKLQAFCSSFPAMILVWALPAYLVTIQIKPELEHPALYVATFLLTAGCALSLNLAWRKKMLFESIMVFCVGFLLTAFAGGFALPKFNDQIGYTNMAHKVQQLEKEWNCSGVITHGVWRAENMDVFFPERMQVIQEADSVMSPAHQGKLLIIRKSRAEEQPLKDFLKDKQLIEVQEKYSAVKL